MFLFLSYFTCSSLGLRSSSQISAIFLLSFRCVSWIMSLYPRGLPYHFIWHSNSSHPFHASVLSIPLSLLCFLSAYLLPSNISYLFIAVLFTQEFKQPKGTTSLVYYCSYGHRRALVTEQALSDYLFDRWMDKQIKKKKKKIRKTWLWWCSV